MRIERRRLIVGATIAGLARPSILRAASQPALNVLTHRIMRIVSVGAAGDITAAWQKNTGTRVEWLTFDQAPLQERLQRELSLPQTTIDVAFVVNIMATPGLTRLLEPLDGLAAANPIDDIDDIFPGLRAPMRIGGVTYGIPFRHSTDGLHYNETLFAERGISQPPRTIEELIETAHKLTYRRADGGAVSGFAIPGLVYSNIVDLARAWDGDFITPDMQFVGDQPPMVKTLTLLRDLFKAGVLPRNFVAMQSEDVNPLMQTGRAAMAITGIDRNRIYNDPEKSQFAGKIKATTIPIAQELRAKMGNAAAKTEFWTMVIPKNARNKSLSWDFIREMTTRPNTLTAALNGNGPVRASTYENKGYQEAVPYAVEAREILKTARIPLPAFDKAIQAADLFQEAGQAVVLGMKQPQQAMDEVGVKIRALLAEAASR